MRLAVILLFAAATLIPTSWTQAQASPVTTDALGAGQVESIDAFVSSEMARQHIPGLAIGIYRRGHILLSKGYGLANVELSVPVHPETVFQSGSVGKQFLSLIHI